MKKGTGKEEELKRYPDGTARFFSYYDDENEFEGILELNGFSVVDYHLKVEPNGDDRWHCFYARKA